MAKTEVHTREGAPTLQQAQTMQAGIEGVIETAKAAIGLQER